LAGVLAGAWACGAPACADDAIAQVNNQESVALALAPVHASEVAQAKDGSVVVNHVAGTRFLFGYDAARARTIAGVPDLYTDLNFSLGVATLRYDGTALASSGGPDGPINEAQTTVEESLRLRLGRTFALFPGQDAALTPFLGVSQKAWGRDASSDSIAFAYDHEGLEGGLLAQARLPGQWVLGADASAGRVLGAVLYSGTGNRIFATTRTFSLKLDHRTFADWHQRLEIRVNALRYGSVGNSIGRFEPRGTNEVEFLLEIGGETSVF
jgi:hypothetical protein